MLERYRGRMDGWRRGLCVGLAGLVIALTGCARGVGVETSGADSSDQSSEAQAERFVTMLPGAGRNPDIEAKLFALDVGYVPNSGAHVATFVGASGPQHFYRFRADDFPEDAPAGFAMFCISVAPDGVTMERIECRLLEDAPRPARGILGASNHVAGARTAMTIDVGFDVETVIVELANGDSVVISPVGGIAYTGWIEEDATSITAVHYDGTSVTEDR